MTTKLTTMQILEAQAREDLAHYGSPEAVIEARNSGELDWRTDVDYAVSEGTIDARERRMLAERAPQDTLGALHERVRASNALAHATPSRHWRAAMASVPEYRMAFQALLAGTVSDDQRQILNAGRFDAAEARDLTTGTGSSGGFTIPQAFNEFLVKSLLDGAPILGLATKVETDAGAAMKVPVIDDTAQLATILAENSTVGSTTDPVLSQVSLGAFCYVAPAVLAPWSWLQDTAGLDALQVLANIAGDRIGRAVDAHLAVGTGSGQPLGISAATVGVTTTSNAAITYAEWEACYFSVRAGYRGPNARWVMHSNTYKAALALLDSGGHPVFDREKGTMFGAPVVCDDSMAQIGASAKVAVFGDFKRGLVVRQVVPTLAQVLHEKYADVLCSAIIVATRIDATLSDAAALRSLAMHS